MQDGILIVDVYHTVAIVASGVSNARTDSGHHRRKRHAEKLKTHHMQKTKYLRSIGLPPADFVFTSRTGTPLEPRDFQRDFKNILEQNELPIVNVHGLRHTFATRSLESGMSVKTLSKILGHSSVGFTLDVYAHVTETLKVEEIGKLQGLL